MDLNREFTRYSSHDEEQKAFTAMQLKGLEIGDVLLKEGKVTAKIDGYHYFVAPFKGKLEVVMTCDYFGKPLGETTLLFLRDIHGQDAEMLDEIRDGFEKWLAMPTFTCGDSWQHCAEALHQLELGLINEAGRRS